MGPMETLRVLYGLGMLFAFPILLLVGAAVDALFHRGESDGR